MARPVQWIGTEITQKFQDAGVIMLPTQTIALLQEKSLKITIRLRQKMGNLMTPQICWEMLA